MKQMIVAALAATAFAAGFGIVGGASAQAMLDPPPDSGFYPCTPEYEGYEMRYAVGIPPYQTVYVYTCSGGSWNLTGIEYY